MEAKKGGLTHKRCQYWKKDGGCSCVGGDLSECSNHYTDDNDDCIARYGTKIG